MKCVRQSILSEYDKECNGYLSKDAALQFIKDTLQSVPPLAEISETELHLIYEELDRSGSGRVTVDDLVDLFMSTAARM